MRLNKILLEPNCKMDELIPSSFNHSSFSYFIINSIFRLLKNIISTILFAPLRYKFATPRTYKDVYKDVILFRLPSVNNQRSLDTVIKEVELKRTNVKVIKDVLEAEYYPLVLMDIYNLLHLPYLWLEFKKVGLRERKIMCYYITSFINTPGVVWFYKKTLKNYRPECVILANDHIFVTLSLELVCEDYGIPTIYVQHASVNYDFPGLHFSISFLDGMDSFLKYTSKGKVVCGKAIVLGAARYDLLGSYKATRRKGQRNCIGIAINELDDNKIVNEFCNSILSHYPDKKIKLRAHPSMKNKPFVLNNKDRIIYTCASDESMIDYLDSIDLQISGDSGVHFDSILGGVRTIAFNLSNYEFGDNYEYVKGGMIALASKDEEVYRFIEDENYNPNNLTVVKRFDESYGKSYAGHCSSIISDFIVHALDFEFFREKYGLKTGKSNNQQYYYIPN